MRSSDVGYKLRVPCSDCPFKRSSPLHSGVRESLPHYKEKIAEGRFGHTCHKTDPRSDGYTDEYHGQVQHCVGVLGMMKKMEIADTECEQPAQAALVHALAGGFDYDDIPTDPDIFGSIEEMETAYGSNMRVHIRYQDGRGEWI